MYTVISTRHLSLSSATRSDIDSTIDHLRRFFRRIYSVRLTLEVAGNELRTVLRVHARSGYYRATAAAASVRQAVASACDAVERQRRRRKRIVVRLHRLARGKSAPAERISTGAEPDLLFDDLDA